MRRVQLRRPNVTAKTRRQTLSFFGQVLDSGRYVFGPFLRDFESGFAAKVGSKHGLGVNSATAGLHLAMMALGIKKGDEVIVPAKTFVSTANAVVFCGGTPVFCDVQERTMNMDPESLKRLVTKRTKAVIPVHVAGQPCDMDEIMEVCEPRGIQVVEDSAHAPYALYKKKCAGTIGKIGVYSFYPDKVIGSADGGMVVTDDEGVAERIRLLRNCGRTTVGDSNIQLIGYNYRMNELQAAMSLVQLRILDSMLAKRNDLADYYDELLRGFKGVSPPYRAPDRTHDFYAYVVKIKKGDREQFREAMGKRGVETSKMFDPIYLFKPYVELFGPRPGLCPVAERTSMQTISIPLYVQLKRSDLRYVVRAMQSVVGEANAA